jgi:hypothetical protein
LVQARLAFLGCPFWHERIAVSDLGGTCPPLHVSRAIKSPVACLSGTGVRSWRARRQRSHDYFLARKSLPAAEVRARWRLASPGQAGGGTDLPPRAGKFLRRLRRPGGKGKERYARRDLTRAGRPFLALLQVWEACSCPQGGDRYFDIPWRFSSGRAVAFLMHRLGAGEALPGLGQAP